jgi:hypothetical protein
MRRGPVTALIATAAGGLALLVLVAALDQRRLAFTLGVRSVQVSARVEPRHEVCQGPVDVSEEFSAVRFMVGTFFRPGVPLEVTVRDTANGAVLARGRNSGRYRDNARLVVPVGAVRQGSRVRVCVRNAGRRPLALYGGRATAAPSSSATLDGRRLDTDVAFDFLRKRPVSMLSIVPTVFERMALFRPGFVGAWTYWLLLAAVALGAPALLALALRDVTEES